MSSIEQVAPVPPRSRLPMPWRVLGVFAATVGPWWFVFYEAPVSRSYDRLTHAARAVLTAGLVVPMAALAWRLCVASAWTGRLLSHSRLVPSFRPIHHELQ